MIRDLASLIEYLYLKSINSDLLDFDIIVNPVGRDNVLGKVCIINTAYPEPNLKGCSRFIFRSIVKYRNTPNPYIRGLNLVSDDLEVFTKDNIYYFSQVPDSFITDDTDCFSYLKRQLAVKELLNPNLITE